LDILSVKKEVKLYVIMLATSSVWSPYRKSDIEALEKVLKRATKIVPHLKHLKYSERLRECKLPTLHYRRIRGDMMETFKILTGKYDIEQPQLCLGQVLL